ncbi:MAG: DNA alkylation repair protein [Clostridia bacterium]|nr:DNA alkylation repair protein [Clostridia bacterium]
MQDKEYRTFQCRLMPTVDPETVIGVRTPELRKFAKSMVGSRNAKVFLNALPHRYYEENNLHAFLIEQMKDFDVCVAALNAFLPYVDNWATCDSMNPPILRREHLRLLPHIRSWIASGKTYAVRFGIKAWMSYFLDEDFSPEYPREIALIRSEEYYVKMMIAWYFATALAKQYDTILPYLAERRLPSDIHEMALRKALESYRIPPAQKAQLRDLRKKA